jgi:hypothetical protein
MAAMQLVKDGRNLGAEDTLQRQIARHEERYVKSCGSGRGGGLQPDPAGADDHCPFRPGELDLDALTVLDVTQVVHAV